MSIRDKLIINAAITGMVPTKADNPHVPVTPEEIAADARRCADAGAAIVHLHARDENGVPTSSPEVYREILRRVREACPEIILCVSTTGRTEPRLEARAAVLDVASPKPEMASLTLGSMNFARQASINAPETIQGLARRMLERHVKPELEIFELGMAEYAHYLIKHQLLEAPFYANILLGNLGTLGASEFNLRAVINCLPAETVWAAAGIGRYQLQANTLGIRLGGHVRVGLEDNLWLDHERTIPAANARLIDRLAQLAKSEGRPLASPAETRRMLGIPSPQVVETQQLI